MRLIKVLCALDLSKHERFVTWHRMCEYCNVCLRCKYRMDIDCVSYYKVRDKT